MFLAMSVVRCRLCWGVALSMFKKLIGALVGLAFLGTVGTANASIIYDVNRVIGAGTVTGFIETDGTLGTLSSGNITDWVFTLTAPNLRGGSPDVIDFATANQTLIQGTAVTASPSQLTFDFDITPGLHFLFLQGTFPFNFYCLINTNGCGNSANPAEVMGFGVSTTAAQFIGQTGVLPFATVASVPEPSTLLLFGVGLIGLAFMRRRKRPTNSF